MRTNSSRTEQANFRFGQAERAVMLRLKLGLASIISLSQKFMYAARFNISALLHITIISHILKVCNTLRKKNCAHRQIYMTVLPSRKPYIMPSTSYSPSRQAIRWAGVAMANLLSSKYFLSAVKNLSSPIALRTVSNIISPLL